LTYGNQNSVSIVLHYLQYLVPAQTTPEPSTGRGRRW